MPVRKKDLQIAFREDAGITALRLDRTISFGLGQQLSFEISETRGNVFLYSKRGSRVVAQEPQSGQPNFSALT
jgi:hypothetical protein